MEIDWQNIFYITATSVMIILLGFAAYAMRMLYVISKIISGFSSSARSIGNIIDDVAFFRKNVKLKVLGFIIRILDKKYQNE